MVIPTYYQWATKIMTEVRLGLVAKIPLTAITKEHVGIFGLPPDRLASVKEAYRRAQYQRARASYANVKTARKWRDLSPERFEEEAGIWDTAIMDLADYVGVPVEYIGRGVSISDRVEDVSDFTACIIL